MWPHGTQLPGEKVRALEVLVTTEDALAVSLGLGYGGPWSAATTI